jgi:hypothetical protein
VVGCICDVEARICEVAFENDGSERNARELAPSVVYGPGGKSVKQLKGNTKTELTVEFGTIQCQHFGVESRVSSQIGDTKGNVHFPIMSKLCFLKAGEAYICG